ncbi:hypothetical protein B0J17DRAFT_773208 [Rhizoctonia solani]|nr:hypothetical protein B0J17DRAFT_773208 [Rhizoctonia solani]
MASEKELAARFESRKGSVTIERRESSVPRPSNYKIDEMSNELTSILTSGGASVEHIMHPLPRSSPPRQAGPSPHDDVEMRPLTRASNSLTGKTQEFHNKCTLSGALEPNPLPPSQPARFLRHMENESLTAKSTTLDSSQSGGDSTQFDAPSKADNISRAKAGQPLNPGIGKPGRSSENLAHDRSPNDHETIPIAKLFARNAAPLHLPELDDWLGKLPRFEFTYPKATHADSAPKPFPPLDLLKGERLKDLIHNSPPTPLWRDWNSVGSTLVNLALSIMGSSVISTFYSLAGLYNAVQIFALILNTIVGNSSGRWRTLFLGTIPNVLALNFGGKLLQSITFLGVLTIVSGGLLFWFYKLTGRWSPDATPEGLLSRDPARGTRAIPFVSFILTVLYLPLSTLSIHAITWSSDFWPVENPYIKSETPDLQPLGPSSEFHDPLDFCWTTTMRKDEINYAPVAVVLGILTLIFMTIWFPIRLGKTIRRSLPVVEPYDALGQRRSEEEVEHEYQRLLERDRSPFGFLYNEYRRKWGSFKALYLGGKLTALLIVAIVSPDSCLTLKVAKHYVSRHTLGITRQSVLLAVMVAFLLVQSLATPFVDPVSNASEWTSRMNFVLTSLLGLLVALDIPGQAFWNGWGLYIVYIITYGLTVYFTVINWNWMYRVIKRLRRRIDFSIDIFSPRLDISPESKHLKQRIWQESWTALLLAAPQCRMPAFQKLVFAEGSESTADIPVPPYLLDFSNSPAERHIENLKILREIGGKPWETCLNAADYFGNAWCIPFPLTVIIRYDSSGETIAITNLNDIEDFVHQNESWVVEKQRELRIALRCLDNMVVQWPYTHTELVGDRFRWIGRRRYHAYQATDYHEARFFIRQQGSLEWNNVNLASGFDVSLQYSKKLILDGSLIGLHVSLELTPQLARFLLLNKASLESRMSPYLNALRDYRTHALIEVESKIEALSYGFITSLYASQMNSISVASLLARNERNLRVRDLAVGYEHAFKTMDERMVYVSRGSVEAWWFLFWDDFWRRNRSTMKPLKVYFLDFDPHYPTSIAYRPLPRPILEGFLQQRGLWSSSAGWYGNWWWLHTGFINKIYFHVNWVVFSGSSKAIHVHIGEYSSFDLREVDSRSRIPFSVMPEEDCIAITTSSGLKAGTAYSDSIMRARRAYRWETLVWDESTKPFLSRGINVLRDHRWHFWHEEKRQYEEYRLSLRGRLAQWLGLSPVANIHWHTGGLSVDVSLNKIAPEPRYIRAGRV